MASRISAAFALALLCAPPADAAAQVRVAPRGGQQGAARGAVSSSDIQDQFDAYALVQAQSALQLSGDQYPRFVRRAREMHLLRRRTQFQRRRLVMQLGELLRGRHADDARIALAMRAIDDQERTSREELRKAYAAIDEVLTVRQRARFRVLEDQLERKKLEMLFRARQVSRR